MTERTQTPLTPFSAARPGLRDLLWLLPCAGRGTLELIRARWQFGRLSARDIVDRNRASGADARSTARPDPDMLARMAWVLPRLSRRLPWRSDCLVQALAAQNWLKAHGVASAIQIGVEHPKDGDFGAHAWLVCDGTVVTGGEIARYHALLKHHQTS